MNSRKNCHRFYFCATGTKGDIYPLLELAKVIAEKNHNITFIVNSFFQDLIVDRGFDFLSMGSTEQHLDFHGDNRIWEHDADVIGIGYRKYLRPSLISSYNHIVEAAQKGRNFSVVGVYPMFNGALMAAEMLNIRSVSVIYAPYHIKSYVSPPAPLRWIFPNWYPSFLMEPVARNIDISHQAGFLEHKSIRDLNKLRAKINLSKIKNTDNETVFSTTHLQLGLFPEWYAMKPSDWPTNLKAIGFPVFNNPKFEGRVKLDEFVKSTGKPIIFTSGTGVDDVKEVFTEGLKICKLLNSPGLFVGGKGKVIKAIKKDSRCLHLDYIDFDYAFSNSRLIVHHGGIGTLSQAVKSGIPQLIRPLAFDQHDNAHRIQKLGLGTYIPASRFDAEFVAPVIESLINNQSMQKRIDRYSAKIRSVNAAARAYDLIAQREIPEHGNFDENYDLNSMLLKSRTRKRKPKSKVA